MSPLVVGILERAVQFLLKDIIPNAASAIPGPFGSLLGAALKTQYAQDLEAKVVDKLAGLTSGELAKFEADCQEWADKEFKLHPEFLAFMNAVKPPTVPTFQLKDDELAALLAAQADGSLRTKLGLQ